MRYTEKSPTVEAVEFTKEIATAADRLTDAKFPAAEKKKFTDFDAFFTDPQDGVDGTWLSVIDVHGDAEFGKYGVFCAREGVWKPLYVGSWGIQYGSDDTFDVLDSAEFEKKYDRTGPRSVTPVKKEGDTK